jgi:hypothetical protein
MRHSEFSIGLNFYSATGMWRCTDVGTRVIVAIRLDAPDSSWYTGPPYAVAESVLDEFDITGCSLDPGEFSDAAPSSEHV